MTETQPSGDTYEERLRVWEKEKKGILSDLQGEREKRHALEEEVRVIKDSLTSAADEDGERPEDRVNRLAQDPDGYIDARIVQFRETEVNPLRQELEMMKIERKIEKGLRWVAKQEKKDYEDIAGSETEEELARLTKEMRNRGFIPTDAEEGTKEAYRLLLEERKQKEIREREREERIEGNRTETPSAPTRSGAQRWTREEVAAMSTEEFTRNEADIKKAAATWK